MIIRATDTELALSGTSAELWAVADRLVEIGVSLRCEVVAETAAEPGPYTRVLALLRVVASGGPIHVSVVGDALVVTGNPEMLRRFASFFRFSDEGGGNAHRHHEWWEGNEYIAEDSRPLVIETRDGSEREPEAE